jgi:cell division protein FtsL
MRSRGALVLGLVIVSALAVVTLRHQNRSSFTQLRALQTERDELNNEWGRLLLEQGAWSEHRRIESLARGQLGMALPESSQVVVVAGGKP